MAERSEGRMARWSRLKTKGGASEAENTTALHVDDPPLEDAPPQREVPAGFEDLPDPANLPGGVQNRNFVPPMTPLADAEGSEEVGGAFEAPPSDGTIPVKALAVDLPERELTPEEEEAVSALPPLENLDKDSDFTPFLADNIPEFIRNRALKILWRSDPLFGFQDGLDDYAENFRVIDKLIDAATQSSYKPGQGYDQPEEADAEGDGETPEATETAEAADPKSDDEATSVAATSDDSVEQERPQDVGNTTVPNDEGDAGAKDA